jgi:GNAT superfamily N-acetyltransferase
MSASLADLLDERLALHPLGLDDLSAVRHLHVSALRTQTVGVLSDAEIAAFARLAYSPDYGDMLMKEEVFGAWLDSELVGTVSWQANISNGLTARIGGIFVYHPRYGIGRRLLSYAEARAGQCGFRRLAVGTTANAVPFFQRLGYVPVSRGVRTFPLDCELPVTFLRKDLDAIQRPSKLN